MSAGSNWEEVTRRINYPKPPPPKRHLWLKAGAVSLAEWVLLVAGIVGIAYGVFDDDTYKVVIGAALLLIYSFVDIAVWGVE